MKSNELDYEIEKDLAQLAKEGKLVDFIIDLLAEIDSIPPEIEINGVALRAPVKPPISDKSCYKKCLKESTKPGGNYKECIKKCKKGGTKWSFEIVAQ